MRDVAHAGDILCLNSDVSLTLISQMLGVYAWRGVVCDTAHAGNNYTLPQ